MRLSLKHLKRHGSQGFTLVEMLVVAPIVIIVITGLVAAMVAMVGDALTANNRAAVAYDTQDALERIEQDVRTAINFKGTFNYLSAPQGRDESTGAFSFNANKDLILTQQATTGSPYDSSRALVYYADQPAGCSEDLSINNVLETRTIYFLKDGSLWRRSVVDAWNQNSVTNADTVCTAPWQRDSCPVGSTMGAAPAATCNTADEELLQNVTEFTPTFYTKGTTTTSNPLLASSVSIKITASKSVGGETITQTSTIRAARRNDVPTDTTPPSAPVITQYNASIDIYNNPTTVSFQWDAPGASGYRVQTSGDGGTTWSAAELTTQNWASVTVPYSDTPARVRVIAYNEAGASSQITSDQVSSPLWTACPLQNGWENYGSPYGNAEYTLTSAKVLVMRGLIRNGTTTSGTTLCNLTEGSRPEKSNFFLVAGNNVPGRVDVHPSGNITLFSGTAGYLSLDQVKFIPAGQATWSSNLSTTNGWQHYNETPLASMSNVQVAKDGQGRAHVRGAGRSTGSHGNNANAFALPGTYAPSSPDVYPVASGNSASSFEFNGMRVDNTGWLMSKDKAATNYYSTQAIWWPSTYTTGWVTPTKLASWTRFDTTYSDLQYKKGSDNLVTFRGLIKGGTATSGTIIGNIDTVADRPTSRVMCTAYTSPNPAPARVDILADGKILLNYGVSNAWLSLAGCSYYAG